MAFRVGMKVVCVDAKGTLHAKPLQHGAIYTIRAVYIDPNDGRGVCLEEILNDMHPRGEIGYRPVRFRPVVERKTDISIFTAMLTGTKKRRVLAQGEEVKS